MMDRDTVVHTWEYRGKTITVDERGTFWIDEENAEHRRASPTLVGAKAEIDDLVAVEAKARHTNLAMLVIDGEGQRYTIRGINRSSGMLLGGPDRADVYYPTPIVEALLKERTALNGRVSEIAAKLRPVRIDERYGSGRVRAEDYDERIQELEAKYAAAMEAAHDLDDAPVIIGVDPATSGDDRTVTHMGLGDPQDD